MTASNNKYYHILCYRYRKEGEWKKANCEACPYGLHFLSVGGTGKRVPREQILDPRKKDRIGAGSETYGTPDKNLVSKSQNEIQEGG